jgi:prepilin-type processing-associated H-X9-DG protein
MLPPGQISRLFLGGTNPNDLRYTDPTEPGLAQGQGFHGTSWFLHLLPNLDQAPLYSQWNFFFNVNNNGDGTLRTTDPAGRIIILRTPLTDLPVLYCPSRRSDMKVAAYPFVHRVNPLWTKGGNDYAGCIGSGVGWFEGPSRTVPVPNRDPIVDRGTWHLTSEQIVNDVTQTRLPHGFHLGVFSVNSNTRLADIGDGVSNVIAVSEVMRLNHPTDVFRQSSDGWAWGGAATLFSTRFGPNKGIHYDNAGSEHAGMVNVLFADGRVRPINDNINFFTWQNLGNMSNRIPVSDY